MASPSREVHGAFTPSVWPQEVAIAIAHRDTLGGPRRQGHGHLHSLRLLCPFLFFPCRIAVLFFDSHGLVNMVGNEAKKVAARPMHFSWRHGNKKLHWCNAPVMIGKCSVKSYRNFHPLQRRRLNSEIIGLGILRAEQPNPQPNLRKHKERGPQNRLFTGAPHAKENPPCPFPKQNTLRLVYLTHKILPSIA